MPDSIASGRFRDQDVPKDKDMATLHVEGDDNGIMMSSDEDFVSTYPDKDKRRLLRKMDLHIIPCLISLYCEFKVPQKL